MTARALTRKKATNGLTENPAIFSVLRCSGLDNVTSLMCVQILKRMAEAGHTVIVSIHTPSAKIFSHFDTVSLGTSIFIIYYYNIYYYHTTR